MTRKTRSYPIFVALLIVAALLLQACAAPTSPAAPAVDAPAAADAAPAAEATPTPDAVSQSRASLAVEVTGVTVVSDEDVTTQRDEALFGGQYCRTATSDGVSFHPYTTTDGASRGYTATVYERSLLRLDENTLEYIPHMAESYTIDEDGLTFTFKLRETIFWSDGEPLTANDFKWTYDQVTNPDNGFPYLSQLAFITAYEALDDYTLEIKIDEIYAPALGQMSGLITPLPKHVWEGLPWDDPERNPEINRPSVVSGAYKLAEWSRDQRVIFEANESFWYRGRPNIERSLIEIVPDSDISYQMMRSGECDTGLITPEKLEEARQLENITLYEYWPAAATWTYIGLNMREGFATHDLNVRRGLAYALDKDLMTDEIMLGQARRQCSVYPETSWVYNPDVPCYDYDVDQALAEFAAAGYTFDGTTMLDADGNPLTLKLIFGPNTSKVRELIAVTVQDYLKQIGIDVEIQSLEWSAYLDATNAQEPDWDMFVGAWGSTIEPHIMYTIWAESSIPDLNSVAYINKDVEQLFTEGGATYDNDLRREKYGEVQRIIAEEAPYIFLYYQKTSSGQNKRVQGIDPRPLGIGWNSEDWYLQDPGQ